MRGQEECSEAAWCSARRFFFEADLWYHSGKIKKNPSRSEGHRQNQASALSLSSLPMPLYYHRGDGWTNGAIELYGTTATTSAPWLDLAHQKLDQAVLDVYGWPHNLSDEEILERLAGPQSEACRKWRVTMRGWLVRATEKKKIAWRYSKCRRQSSLKNRRQNWL